MNNIMTFKGTDTITIDSREVAEMISKSHNNLLRDINNYTQILMNSSAIKIDLANFFIESTYQDEQRKPRPCYLLTRKGCEFVANKMTGEKGIIFTAAYINKFHEMEDALQANAKEKPKLESYEYFPKTYKGEPVVTSKDLAYLIGIQYNSINWIIRNKDFIKGVDYFFLERLELRDFKEENPKMSKLGGALIVITKSGFEKIAGLYNNQVNTPECFSITVEKQRKEIVKAKKPVYDNLTFIKTAVQALQSSISLYEQEPYKNFKVKHTKQIHFNCAMLACHVSGLCEEAELNHSKM